MGISDSNYVSIIALGFALYHVAVVQSPSGVQLFVTPWTVACQAPLSMGFSSQEYWSGLPFPSPGDLPNPRIEPRSPARDFHFLLQGIFQTQVSNLYLLLVRWIHYPWTTSEAHSLLQYWLNSEALWGQGDCQQCHSLCSSSKGKYLSPVAPTLGLSFNVTDLCWSLKESHSQRYNDATSPV